MRTCHNFYDIHLAIVGKRWDKVVMYLAYGYTGYVFLQKTAVLLE